MGKHPKVFAKRCLTMEKQQIIDISNSMGCVEGERFIMYVRCIRRFLADNKRLFEYTNLHSKIYPCSLVHSIFSALVSESIKDNRMPTIRRVFAYAVSRDALYEYNVANAFARISPQLLEFMRNLYYGKWRLQQFS